MPESKKYTLKDFHSTRHKIDKDIIEKFNELTTLLGLSQRQLMNFCNAEFGTELLDKRNNLTYEQIAFIENHYDLAPGQLISNEYIEYVHTKYLEKYDAMLNSELEN